MFENDIEKTIIGTAFALWFAHGWYLNEKLKDVHKKLDRVLECFEGLRNYLYEIDPQFDDERRNRMAFERGESTFAGLEDMKLTRAKESEGKRTLNSSFIE